VLAELTLVGEADEGASGPSNPSDGRGGPASTRNGQAGWSGVVGMYQLRGRVRELQGALDEERRKAAEQLQALNHFRARQEQMVQQVAAAQEASAGLEQKLGDSQGDVSKWRCSVVRYNRRS
jgi:hypothetical protein